MREIIHEVMSLFYERAINDILIGYHFTKFQDEEILRPHLERLASFWEMQLLGRTTRPVDKGFQLLMTHFPLRLRKGELGRWIVLFHDVLDEMAKKYNDPEIKKICDLWKERIALFEDKFKSHPQMFNQI